MVRHLAVALVTLLLSTSAMSQEWECSWGEYCSGAGEVVSDFDASTYGVVGNGITNDTANAQAAVDAACAVASAADPQILTFPDGTYRIGALPGTQPATAGFYSGIQITCSNITITSESYSSAIGHSAQWAKDNECSWGSDCYGSEGVTIGAEFLPSFERGGTIFAACPAYDNVPYGENKDCDTLADISNVHIIGVAGRDDDPEGHCITCDVHTAPYGSEETHFATFDDCQGCSIEYSEFEAFGDETITFGASTNNSKVDSNSFTNTPGLPYSGGAAIVLDCSDCQANYNTLVSGLDDPNSTCPTCQNRGAFIALETNQFVDHSNVTIKANNILSSELSRGVVASSASYSIDNLAISGNVLRSTSTDSTVSCLEVSTLANYLGQAGQSAESECAIHIDGAGGTGLTRDNLTITKNNLINGGIRVTTEGGVGTMDITNNTIENISGGIAIEAGGNPATISNNSIDGVNDAAIYVVGLDTDTEPSGDITVADNVIVDAGEGASGTKIIEFFIPASPCGTDGNPDGFTTISGNSITAASGTDLIENAIHPPSCAQATVTGNTIDMNGAHISSNRVIIGATTVTDNTITGSPAYGIFTADDDVTITGNRIEGNTQRGIYSVGAARTTISNNVLVDTKAFAIDATGADAVCTSNGVFDTDDAFYGSIRCSQGAATGGCDADTDLGGTCTDNTVCDTDTNTPCVAP